MPPPGQRGTDEIDSVENFGKLFNSPLEAGIRAVVVLEKLRPEAADLAEMVLLDHVVVHTANIGGPPSLHPDLSDREGELMVRRRLIERSLDLMRRCHLVDQEITDDGALYRASDGAAGYVELLETAYSSRLKECADWIAGQIRSAGRNQFKDLLREQIGDWADAFGAAAGTSLRG